MSIKIEKLSPQSRDEALNVLYKTARNIQGEEPVITFINDLLTDSEKITIGRRVMIAMMLMEGETRTNIRERLQVSPNTVSQTRQWLNKKIPGYEEIVESYKSNPTPKQSKKLWANAFNFAGTKNKKSEHFLLLNMFSTKK